jgi:hypothetical protein
MHFICQPKQAMSAVPPHFTPPAPTLQQLGVKVPGIRFTLLLAPSRAQLVSLVPLRLAGALAPLAPSMLCWLPLAWLALLLLPGRLAPFSPLLCPRLVPLLLHLALYMRMLLAQGVVLALRWGPSALHIHSRGSWGRGSPCRCGVGTASWAHTWQETPRWHRTCRPGRRRGAINLLPLVLRRCRPGLRLLQQHVCSVALLTLALGISQLQLVKHIPVNVPHVIIVLFCRCQGLLRPLLLPLRRHTMRVLQLMVHQLAGRLAPLPLLLLPGLARHHIGVCTQQPLQQSPRS